MGKEIDSAKKERYRAEVLRGLNTAVNMVMCVFDGVTLEGKKMKKSERFEYILHAVNEFKRVITDNIKL